MSAQWELKPLSLWNAESINWYKMEANKDITMLFTKSKAYNNYIKYYFDDFRIYIVCMCVGIYSIIS